MRIAMITSDYYPNIGGIASHTFELSRHLIELGHIVEVWAYMGKAKPSKIYNIPVREIPLKPIKWTNAWTLAIHLHEGLKKLTHQFKPEIIHCHTMAPLSLSCRWLRSEKWRTIFTNHSSGYLNNQLTWAGRLRNTIYCSKFDGLIAPSQELLNKSKTLRFPIERKKYIPNAIDTSMFSPGDMSSARKKLRLPNDKPIILSTRRFVEKNGIRYLALAIPLIKKNMPNILCIFCGNSSNNPELRHVTRIIREYNLGDNVRLEGEVPNKKILTYLRASDVVVLPSLIEATSISGLEAMGAGKPLVGTRVGGIPDIINDGHTGILVPPKDPLRLGSAVVSLLKNREKIETFGQAARDLVVSTYSWPIIARRTVEFYKKIYVMQLRYNSKH